MERYGGDHQTHSRELQELRQARVELRPFNIVVGSNASGKSNFLEVFRFLRDIEATSLETAIGIRGGGETLRNFNLDENQVLRICVETDDAQRLVLSVQQDSAIVTEINRTAYEFLIRYDKSDSGYQVLKDSLTEYFTMLETLPMADLVGPEAEPPLSRVLRPEVWDPDTYEVLRSLATVGRCIIERTTQSSVALNFPQTFLIRSKNFRLTTWTFGTYIAIKK